MRDYSNSQFESKPLQGSVVDLVNQNEQFNANRRAEKLEKEKFQYLKEDRDRTWREKFLQDNLKQQDFIDVKDADLNNMYARTVTKAMDKAGELAMKLAHGNGTPEDRVKLHLLNQTSDKLKALNGPIGDIITKLNNGELHDDPELRSFLGNIGNAEIDFSEKGELELVIQGENGSKRIPYSDAVKGIDGFKLIPKIDPIKGFIEFTKDIKPEEIETYNGYEKTKTKGVSTELATQLAESYLYPSNKMSNALKSALKSAGFDPYNLTADAANYALQLKDELAQRLIDSRDRSNKKEFDWTASQGAERLAETKKQNNISNSLAERKFAHEKNEDFLDRKEKQNTLGGVVTKADSNVFRSAEKKFGKLSDAFVPQKPIDLETLNINGKDYQDVKVYGIAYDSKGNAILEIDEASTDDSDTKTRKKSAVKITKQTEAKIANAFGYSTEELRQGLTGTTKQKIDY